MNEPKNTARYSVMIQKFLNSSRTLSLRPACLADSSPFMVSLQSEHIDGTALRHLRILAWEQQVHASLHLCRIDPPARLHRDVLFAVDLERDRHRGDSGYGRVLPEDLAARGVERAEEAIIGAA